MQLQQTPGRRFQHFPVASLAAYGTFLCIDLSHCLFRTPLPPKCSYSTLSHFHFIYIWKEREREKEKENVM